MRIPVRKWQHLLCFRISLLPVFALGVLSAAMFAEPAVTNIEEVIGLIQGSGVVTGPA